MTAPGGAARTKGERGDLRSSISALRGRDNKSQATTRQFADPNAVQARRVTASVTLTFAKRCTLTSTTAVTLSADVPLASHLCRTANILKLMVHDFCAVKKSTRMNGLS